jgi:IS605 OrfB family transposase
VSYTITRKPGRSGRYLSASWAIPAVPYRVGHDDRPASDDVYAPGPVVGVDLNDGHLALRRLLHGNPVGAAARINFELSGSSSRRDAQVRHAITQLIHYCQRYGITAVAVEDLDFADARTTGRETMGRGARGKRFRRTVSRIPTAVFRNRLTDMADRAGISLFAVNPAYSSIWGNQHWRRPYPNVTRHQAAATVIGRRAQGFTARRREGVTPKRPEDRAVRATNQTGPASPQVNTSRRHQSGNRGSTSRQPNSTRKRLPGRATVTPALANNGQLRAVTVYYLCATPPIVRFRSRHAAKSVRDRTFADTRDRYNQGIRSNRMRSGTCVMRPRPSSAVLRATAGASAESAHWPQQPASRRPW